MRTLIAVLALALSLSACGDDDPETRSGGQDEPETSATESDEPDADPTNSAPVVTGPPPPACELATEADVEAAYDEDVSAGLSGGGSYSTSEGLEYTSENCTWDVEDVDDGLDVKLAVSVAKDYPDGELICPELDSFDVPGTPVPELLDGALWSVDKVDPDEGTLRVCLDTLNFDIDMESPSGSRDPDTMRAQTIALAEVVLANLG